jgi:transcriptional regulator with XRE-family HTH domain
MTKTTRIDKMLPRSLQLNREWFAKVQETLALRQLTQNAIAKKLQVSPLSVSKFINGKPIALNTFIRLSDEFNLDWQEISQAERDWNDTIENFKFKQSQFKANPGGDIAPEEVIGRDQLIITLWERLRQQSLIYLGERRIGKSSVLKKMKTQAPADILPIYRDLEGIRKPIDFVEGIWQDTETYLRNTGTTRRVRDFLSQITSQPFKEYRFPLGIDEHWKILLIKTIEDLLTIQNRQVVFIWDEISHMLGNFSDEEAMELLDTLRGVRQTYADVRMLFSGSIGLHHIIKNLQKSGYRHDPTNDMYAVDGHPLTLNDATDLTIRLLQGEKINSPNLEAIAQEIAKAVDCIPFYIHHLIYQLKEVEGEITRTKIMETVDQSLRNPFNPWKMDHYRERIDNYYTPQEKPYALDILDILSMNTPISFQKLWQCMNSNPKTNDQETTVTVLRLLMKDYYLIQLKNISGNVYGFRYPLIQKYWRISRGFN